MRTLSTQRTRKKVERLKFDFFVFDVETTKLEPQPKNFVFGVLYGFAFVKVIKTITDFKKEFSKKKYKGKTIFAHNAEFDLSTIFGNIYINMDNSAIFNGRFISAKWNGVTFADSFNIFPSSVYNVGKTMGIDKIENEKVKVGKLRKNNITQLDIDYCKRDCEIVYKALLRLFEMVGAIKITISSLAMYEFRNKFLSDKIVFSELVDEFYNSYYGGRVECFKIGKVNANCFDINSIYPFAMINTTFPDIQRLKKETKISLIYFDYLLRNFEGLANVDVYHEPTYFGYLPVKTDKLIFPIGRFNTTVNFNELRFAISKGVVKVEKVHFAVFANAIETPFKDFVNHNYNGRIESKNPLDNLIYKLKLNSLYGRFAMRIKYNTTYHEMLPFDIIEELDKNEKFYELKLFNEKRNDCFLITENDKFKNSFFAIPTFSSYITSYARIYLLQSLIENENNNVVYCDTDSIFLENNFVGLLGNDLGQWKKEKKQVIEINGLKNYRYVLNGETFNTIKGISKKSIQINENTFEIVKYYKTKESLRRNLETGKQYIQTKTLKHTYDKRIVLPNGNTKPIEL